MYLPDHLKTKICPKYGRKNKYNAKKTVVDGIIFDSKKEADRYQELKLMQINGDISLLGVQPVIVLQDKFKYQGKTERAITYRADFEYWDDQDRHVIEDVKASKKMKTEVYKIKRKLFLKQNPDIIFKEIY